MILASFVEIPVESPNMEVWQDIHGEVSCTSGDGENDE